MMYLKAMEDAHQSAEAIRNKYRTDEEVGSRDGYTYIVSDKKGSKLYSKDDDKIAGRGSYRKETNKINGSDIDDIRTNNSNLKLVSSTLDPITKAAVNEAQTRLDKIIDKYYPYEWPESYKIGYKTWNTEYKQRYLKEVEKAESVASFFDTLDLADNIRTSYMEVSEATGGEISATIAGTIVFTAFKQLWDEQPGIGDLPDALGISKALNKNIAIALEKSEFIDNSNFKYLVHTGQFLWAKGPRGKFIEQITTLEDNITNRTETRYKNEQYNIKYKQSLLNYLEVIKNMNINYDKSLSDMNYLLDRIDEKYKYR